MLTKLFPNLLDKKLIKFINKFYYSIFYIILIGIFVILSSSLGIEIPIYIATAVISGLIPALFCEDMISVLAPVSMYYCTFSLKRNNPITHVNAFNDVTFRTSLIVVASVIAVILITRLVFDLIKKSEKKGFPRLLPGFIVLTIFFMVSGLGSTYFEPRSVLIGALEGICFSITYLYLFYSVNWKKFKVDYVMLDLLIFGFVIALEIFISYFITKNMPNIEGRDRIMVGWGIHTNMGGMACLFVAVPFYFVIKNKKPILMGFSEIIFLASVLFAQARGPILTAAIIFIAAFIIMLCKTNAISRHRFLLSLIISFCFVYGIAKIKGDVIDNLFEQFIKLFTDSGDIGIFSSDRIEIYKNGLSKFNEYKVLGTGWYSCSAIKFTQSFFPARWHNTIIQVLATGGILLTLAYLYHRFETVWIMFKNHKLSPLTKVFLYLPVIALIISSMFDCFMFNLGPGLLYGVLLVAIEKGCELQN